MSKAEFVRELDNYGANKGGSACLVKLNDEYFVISSIPSAPDTGKPETLAFAADENAEVVEWSDLAGGQFKSREDTIAELEENGPDDSIFGRGAMADPESGPTSEEFASTMATVFDAMRKSL